jgi:hypothetical protein
VTTPPIIPDWVPTQFGIGTTVQFTRSFDDFPSNDPDETWTYTIYWNGPQDKFNKQAEAVSPDNPGPGFFVWLKPADTRTLHAGPYRYCERLTNTAGDVWDLSGETLVSNLVYSPADAPAGAFQTWEEQTLAMLQAALAGNTSPLVQSYQIAGRAVSSYPANELHQLVGIYKSVVWRQQHPGSLGVSYDVIFRPEPQKIFPIPRYWR